MITGKVWQEPHPCCGPLYHGDIITMNEAQNVLLCSFLLMFILRSPLLECFKKGANYGKGVPVTAVPLRPTIARDITTMLIKHRKCYHIHFNSGLIHVIMSTLKRYNFENNCHYCCFDSRKIDVPNCWVLA